MINKHFLPIVALSLSISLQASSQNKDSVNLQPHLSGTIRGKYEYQPEDKRGRFQVRTARFSLEGKVTPIVAYKAEIDLSDQGTIRMLDANTSILPTKNLKITIGQMRVPFTIDAHRSPHEQYFANRSFIAKQVGNVRDVGITMGYDFQAGIPMRIEGGLFNGSGLTNQKDFWTNEINFSTKLQAFIPGGWNITLSTQKTKPNLLPIMMYDIGTYYHSKGWHAEVEYLYKRYDNNAFQPVHSLNVFSSYDIKLNKCLFHKITPLIRYDYMSNHSDGYKYLDGEKNELGSLIINDHKRARLTAGTTLSLAKPFVTDIRLNYERYFYEDNSFAKASEKTKFVIEVMTRF